MEKGRDVQKRKEFIINGGVWDYTPASIVITKEHFGQEEENEMKTVDKMKDISKPENNQ